MTGMHHVRRCMVFCSVVGLLPAVTSPAIGEQPARANGTSTDRPISQSIPGFTQPFRSSTLGAERTGRVLELPVEEGDEVKAGQVVARLADAFQRARAERARLVADSSLAIDQARVRYQYAAEELKRIEALAKESSAASREILAATTESQSAQIALNIAQLEFKEAKLAYDAEKASLDQLCVRAPFDGYVAERLSEVGEIVEESDKILEIVQIDKLLVICDVPVTQVKQLRTGDALMVNAGDSAWVSRKGRVVLVDRVADAASQTVRVKLEINNADHGWLAGMKVFVDLASRSETETALAIPADAHRPVQEERSETQP